MPPADPMVGNSIFLMYSPSILYNLIWLATSTMYLATILPFTNVALESLSLLSGTISFQFDSSGLIGSINTSRFMEAFLSVRTSNLLSILSTTECSPSKSDITLIHFSSLAVKSITDIAIP